MKATDYLNIQCLRLNLGSAEYKICLQDDKGNQTNWITIDHATMQEVIKAMGATVNITNKISDGYVPKDGELVMIC